MTEARACLTALAYRLGELVPLSQLEEPGLDADTLAVLEAGGLSTFSRSDSSAVALASDSLAETLARSEVAPQEIDAVFLATESWAGEEGGEGSFKEFRQALYRELHRHGLKRAYPCAFSLSGCANLMSALAQAGLAVERGLYRNVLVVACDRYPAPAKRLVPPAVAVLSDGAASGLVTARPAAGFALGLSDTFANLNLHSVGEGLDLGRHLVEVGRSVKALGDRMAERTGRAASDYGALVLNNYSLSTVRMLAQQLGFQLKQVYRRNIPRTSHVSGADIFINLGDLWQEPLLEPGARVRAVASGPASWAALDLETRR